MEQQPQTYRFTWQGMGIEAVYQPRYNPIIAHLEIRNINPAPSRPEAAMSSRRSARGWTRKPPNQTGRHASSSAGRERSFDRSALAAKILTPTMRKPEIAMSAEIAEPAAHTTTKGGRHDRSRLIRMATPCHYNSITYRASEDPTNRVRYTKLEEAWL